jgi:hypothetical protein
MKTEIQSDKIYKLLKGTPISYTLASRSSTRYPLLWFDSEKNINRPLRYAPNQKSPFEDEQDNNVILEPIVFVDGFLSVPKTNPVLQQFLYYHPHNGIVFTMVNKEADASKELDTLTMEADALIAARELSIPQLEMLTRIFFGKDPSLVSTAELKRDILIFAKKDPKSFLNTLDDPELTFQSTVRVFFEKNLLTIRNNGKELWFNTPTNKKKMCSIPFGQDPYETADFFLRSEDGVDALKMLESNLEM